MNRYSFSILVFAFGCWAGSVQAGGIGKHQIAACRDAVLGLQEFPNVDYDNIAMSPERIDKHGRAVVNWHVETDRIRANGHCRVERDGEVAEVKISDFKDVRPSRRPQPLAGITLDVDVARHGDPYDEFDTRGPEDCARACLEDDRCNAYNYRVAAHRCKLKEDFHEKERERGVISGERTATPATPVRAVEMKVRRDYALKGDPYRDFPARSYEQCRDTCAAEERCIGFNYHTDDGACGLKDYIEDRRRREGVISGEKVDR